ncbi:MAG: hypothetical protein IPI10_08740 [Bacteroidetes bacterium]|nr:hypothetical protein [Bacteroidota bacterium]
MFKKKLFRKFLIQEKGVQLNILKTLPQASLFFLSTECDTALNYFTAALKVNQTPSLSKLISDMSKGSHAASSPPPSAAAPVAAGSVNNSSSDEKKKRK